jgi:hypothetical protein
LAGLDESDDRASSARRTGPALEAMYRFIIWLEPTVEKFRGARSSCSATGCDRPPWTYLERLIEAT